MKKKTKIWLGVGAFVVAGSAAATAPWTKADASTLPDFTDAAYRCAPSQARFVVAQNSQPAAAGGEQGGEQGMAELPPDLAFARTIALIRGHLLIGDQLVKEGQWLAAYPHFMHPTEELYDLIRANLKDYKTPAFDGALKKLAAVVKEKKSAQYAKALTAVMHALEAANAGLKSKQQDWASFTLESAVEAMKVAPGEYGASIVDGQIAKPVEYQDARGFIWQADRMIESVAPALEKKDAGALKAVRSAVAALKQVFPTAVPPKTPIKDGPAVTAAVSQVELAAGPLL